MGGHGTGGHVLGHAMHEGAGWTLWGGLAVLAVAVAAVGYALAVATSRRRRPWPVRRTVCWYAGLTCAGAGLLAPTATAATAGFTGHMAGHLLLGMAAPLLLVLGAPLALALRALPVAAARALSGLLRRRTVRVLTHPVVAGVLAGGGLWVLYTTDLYGLMHTSAPLYALVHVHLFLAGYVFTGSLVGVDPQPHRASVQLRATVLVIFIAAHAGLARWLYAHPPAGVTTSDARAGAQLMYYGGDAVDLTLVVLLLAGWYRATRPRPSSAASAPASTPAAPG